MSGWAGLLFGGIGKFFGGIKSFSVGLQSHSHRFDRPWLILLLYFIYLRRRRRSKKPVYKPIDRFATATEALSPDVIHEARTTVLHPIPSTRSPRQEDLSPRMVARQPTYSMYAPVEDQDEMVSTFHLNFTCAYCIYTLPKQVEILTLPLAPDGKCRLDLVSTLPPGAGRAALPGNSQPIASTSTATIQNVPNHQQINEQEAQITSSAVSVNTEIPPPQYQT